MRVSSKSPRRQRKALYTADTFERRRRMTVPLSRELRSRFHRRAVPIRKGDTVRVLAGSFVGREERVARVNRRDYAVTLDNVTLKMADEKLKPLEIRPGHLVITRLNLSDPWRRRSLKVSEEEVTPEERGEAAEPEEAVAETPAPSAAPAAPAETKPAEPEEEEAAPEAEPKEAPKPASRRRAAVTAEKAEEDDA
jgi:large subunit ribosomal protein L24